MIMCVLLCYPVSIRIYYQQGGLFLVSFEHAVQLPFTLLLYSTFPDNYAFLSLVPSQIKNTQSADTVPVHGHSPLV